MKTPKSVKIVAIIMLLAVAVSAGVYFLQRQSAACARDEADINAIYQVVGEFGARLRNVPNDTLLDLEDLAAKKGIGVHTVNGVKLFRLNDGTDLEMTKSSDGSDDVVDKYNEVISLKTALQWQLGLPITGEAVSSADEDLGKPLPTIQAVDSYLRRLITDRLYQAFVQDPSTIPGRPAEGPWPDRIQIDSVKKLSSTSYTVVGKVKLMTSAQTATGGVAGQNPIILTLMLNKVDGNWLIDAVTQSSLPMMP
jgi:hypothetical protein